MIFYQLPLVAVILCRMWASPNFPDDAVRTELHLSGPVQIAKYLHDLILEIKTPFDSYEEPYGYIFVYTSPDHTQEVFKRLYNKLYLRHPDLIGLPEGVSIEDGVLCFKGCEVLEV